MEFCDDRECADCCLDAVVPLLNSDVDQITKHGFYDVYFVDEHDGIKTLRTREDGSCVFFDKATRQCEIYESRPERCKLNPYCICDKHDEPHVSKNCSHSSECKDNPDMHLRMHEFIVTLQHEVEWRRKTGYF